jgi:hypothetical protein
VYLLSTVWFRVIYNIYCHVSPPSPPSIGLQERLLLHVDFLEGSLTATSFLDTLRLVLVNTVEDLLHLAKGLTDADTKHYHNILRMAAQSVEAKTEL